MRLTRDGLPHRFPGLRASKHASTLGRIGRVSGEGTALRPRRTGIGLESDGLRNNNIRRVGALDGSEACFSLHGEFDICNKVQLSGALGACVASRTLTVDLADATFIDASTLSVFAHVAGRRRELDATRLRIVNLSTHLRKIFSICQLDNVFDIEGAGARAQPRLFMTGSLAVATLP